MRGNTISAVRDTHFDVPAITHSSSDKDLSSLGGKLDRVAQQVNQNLAQLAFVGDQAVQPAREPG